MKRLFVALFTLFALCGIAQAQMPPYALQIFQVEPGGTYFFGRYMTPASPTGSYFMMYDGSTSQPKLGAVGNGLAWDGSTLSAGAVDWSSLTGKPSTFTPSAHTHDASDIVSGVISAARLPARSFNYTTRSLNTCFQVSSTRDAIVTYGVEVQTSLSLTGGQQGTAYLRLYTNSACSAGQQEVTRFTNGQTGALTVGLSITQTVTGILHGVVPAGMWAQIVTENNTGSPGFTARPGQESQL